MTTPHISPPAITKKVILISGSSHAGKSTLSRALAEKLGWAYRSTDKLARHPGRPWNHDTGILRENVAEHFATLSVDEMMTDVLAHYRKNVLPQVADILEKHSSEQCTENLVMEGCALWPEEIVKFDLSRVGAIWITADDEVFKTRMYAESRFEDATKEGQHLITKFLARTLRFNQCLRNEVARLGLMSVTPTPTSTVEELVEQCLSLLGMDNSQTS